MFDRLACSPTCCLPTCRWLCGVLFLLASCLPVSAQSLSQKLKTESVETLAKDAREKGNAIVGAILLTRKDLACTRCHDSGATQPIAPSLRQMAADEPVSDVHLVESLLQPSKVIKKGYESVRVLNVDGQVITGRPLTNNDQRLVLQVFEQDVRQIELAKDDIEQLTTAKQSLMPDNLVDQLANRQQFLDLTRYLMELKENKPASNLHAQPVGGETIRPALRGVALLSELNCTACHSGNQELALPAKTAPNLQQSSNAIRPEFLLRFIADPVTVKPGTTMPDVMAHLTPAQRQQAATELTHYVVSLSDQSLSDQPLDAQASDRGKELFHGQVANCAGCHGVDGVGGVNIVDYDDWSKEYSTRLGITPTDRQTLEPFEALGALRPRLALPRELAGGYAHGGADAVTLYRRITQGIAGTPMPAVMLSETPSATALTPDQVWDLVHYVQSLLETK